MSTAQKSHKEENMGIGMAIENLRGKLIADINGAGLPPAVVELVLQPIMAELHTMTLGQLEQEQRQEEAHAGNADGTE